MDQSYVMDQLVEFLSNTAVFTATLAGIGVAVIIWWFSRSDKVLEEYEVGALYVYPIKSCKGVPVKSRPIYERGFKSDRQWMVVTEEEGAFMTQRQKPKMALIQPSLPNDDSQELVLNAPGMPEIRVPIVKVDRRSQMDVYIWGDRVEAVDQGDAAAAWLTAFLSTPEEPLRLVRVLEGFVRPTKPQYARGYQTGFADAFPFLGASEGSLEDLNARLQADLTMARFRPKGCKPFAEDSWLKLKVGSIPMKIVKPCDRCKVPTVDPDIGQFGKEKVTETLRTFRTGKILKFSKSEWANEVYFGQNLVADKTQGVISVGDKVQVLQKKK